MDDLISRSEVLKNLVAEYNRRYMLGEKDGLRLAWIEKAVNDTPSVEPKAPSSGFLPSQSAQNGGDRTTDDLISRQAAIDALNGEIEITGRTNAEAVKGYVRLVKDRLERLPSAQPMRKKGEWIYGEDDGQDGWFCSECKRFIPWDYDYYGLNNIDFIKDFKTCPFCDSCMSSYTGADMRGGEDATD